DLDFKVRIDRGELILPNNNGNGNGANPASGYNDKTYLRYKNTPSGISPRAVPAVAGHIFTAATDEHDEDGTLISDEFTNPQKRPVRSLSPERNRLRSTRSHPQVRRRTLHATPHCRSGEIAIGRHDPPFRSCP